MKKVNNINTLSTNFEQNPNGIFIPKDYTVYVKPTERDISERKLNSYKKYSEIKQWGIKNPTKFLKEFIGIELLDEQEYVFMNSWTKPFALWLESRNAGKALALDTPIATPQGYKTMGELNVGDYVYSIDGTPTKIIHTSPIFINHDCYEVTFSDGEKITCDAEHLWYVQTKGLRKRAYINNFDKGTKYSPDKYGFVTLKTSDIYKDYKRDIVKHNTIYPEYKYRVPLPKPLEQPEIKLPIHPYLLGMWLGDGDSRNLKITCGENDIQNTCDNIKEIGYIPTIHRIKSQYCPYICINTGIKGKTNPTLNIFRELNLIKNKHIPDIYLKGSIQQRLSLLQGLMDTDGTCDPQGRCGFSQKSYTLISQVSNLLNSLCIPNTISSKISTCNGKKFSSYVIYFKTDKQLPCFRLKRKYNRLKDNLLNRSTNKTIISVQKVDSVPTKCIQVEHARKLYLCGKQNTVTHNSTMLALFTMIKGLLFNNYRVFICSGTASQSQETFKKIEDIAMKNIESMTGLTDVFKDEVYISQANTTGFIHNPACFTYTLFNGSFVKTLNSNVDSARGYRAECVVFDEGGWLTENQFNVLGAFTAQNSNFKLGGNVQVDTLPKEFPHQLLYASSASSVDTAFFKKYRDFSKKMILGDPNYFVADINCDIVINATFKGKLYPTPLLTKETVAAEMRINPEKAAREYYNRFTKDGGFGQIIKRALIAKNSYNRPPVMTNTDSKRKFVFAYDPARSLDNSILSIGELRLDDKKGYMLDVVNCINFADVSLKKHTPLTTQEQIRLIKEELINYNGKELEWDNIECFMIDAGAGGGGNRMPDFFFENWKDKNNVEHRGLVDADYSAEYVKRFPSAVKGVLKMVEPVGYKADMFEALIKMVEADLITFPEKYDNKGYINLLNVDDKKYKQAENKIRNKLDKLELSDEEYKSKFDEEMEMQDIAETEVYKLSVDEEIALSQITAMTEEIVNICRIKREGGKDGFKLPAHKDAEVANSEGTMHDDRAYTLAMLGWFLSEKRREYIKNHRPKKKESVAEACPIRVGKRKSAFDY